ncbi:hypothetical protein GOODEAATRI_008949 [Goodea atripinnis]|uniref:Ig-like domain-containing protein n=1 Tax=Goodea atripinnis TaxID=208336 RepID=A0ABV0NSY3_9TELE
MPDFVKPLADVEVIEGKETMLKCKVSGLPYPTIAWYHNGKRIESSEERKMIQRMSTAWSFGELVMLTGASTRQSFPTKWVNQPATLTSMLQQQPLGSIQWSVAASNLKETNYTVPSLSKGVRYAFRVLTSTGKTLSKPSPSTDLVQLLDRGTKTAPTGVKSALGRNITCCFILNFFRAIFEESTCYLGQT